MKATKTLTRTVGTLAVMALVVGLLAGPAAAQPDDPAPTDEPNAFFDGDPSTSDRVDAGDGRQAAVLVSRSRFPEDNQRQHAFLARVDDYADALAGSSLTPYGPLLFTSTDGMHPGTEGELVRVLADGATVWLLGGTAAVSANVEARLEGLGFQTRRLSGPERVTTSLAIADQLEAFRAQEGLHRVPSRVLIARGHPNPGDASQSSGWADAIAAAGVSGRNRIPVLLTHDWMLTPAVAEWIEARRFDIGHVVFLGGHAAIDQSVEEHPAISGGTLRAAGASRDLTALAVGRYGNNQSIHDDHRRYIVMPGWHADGWAFGLAAAGVAADTGATLLLDNHVANQPMRGVAEPATSCGTKRVEMLYVGSTAHISSQRAQQIEALDGSDCDEVSFGGTPDAPNLCETLTQAEVETLFPTSALPLSGGAAATFEPGLDVLPNCWWDSDTERLSDGSAYRWAVLAQGDSIGSDCDGATPVDVGDGGCVDDFAGLSMILWARGNAAYILIVEGSVPSGTLIDAAHRVDARRPR